MNQHPNWARPFTLAVVLVLLGSLAWWLQFKHDPDQEAQQTSEKKPFTFPKDSQITQLSVDNGTQVFAWKCLGDGGNPCKLASNSKWQMETPIQSRADDTNVNALVSSLDRLQAVDMLDLKDETPEKRLALLKEYGLDPAQLSSNHVKKIRLETATQGTWVAYFGNTHPVSDGFFTLVEHEPQGQAITGKVDQNRVLITPSFFKSNFDHNLTFWRDKKILSMSASEVAAFQIRGRLSGDPKNSAKGTWIEGVKNTQSPPNTSTHNSWTLNAPEGKDLPGDIETIDAMLTGASFITAKDIVSENKNSPEAKKVLKATKPLFTLTLEKAKTAKEAQPITVSLFEDSEKTPKLYATVSNMDALFELQNNARNQLGKTLKELRLSKLMTSEDRFTAKKIEFSGAPLGSTVLSLSNQNGQWSLAGAKHLDDVKVQALLDKLSGKRIQEFLTTAPAGEAAGLKLSLWTDNAGGSSPRRQLLFWVNGDKLYARDLLSKRKEIFVIDPSVRPALPWAGDFFEAKPDSKPSPASKAA
jgi:hypothetical protein